MIKDIWQDLRFGARVLGRSPGFTLSAVLALALGIGTNTAVFSVFDTLLLRPLPYPHSERIVKITGINLPQDVQDGQISPPDVFDWQAQNKVFDHLAVYRGKSLNLMGDGEPERLVGALINTDFLPLFGVKPFLGRNFTAAEDAPGGPPVVLLSHGFWQRRFAGDRSIIGKSLNLDGTQRTVVGVLPASFRFPEIPDIAVWRPIGIASTDPRDARFLNALGRLKPGVDLRRAQVEMDALTSRLEQQYPESNKGWRVRLEPLHETLVHNIRPLLVVTLASVGLLLLISCANVANLLLARASSRQKEIAIRTALGAGRPRIVRQFLLESLLLAVAGSALGLLLAHWGVRFLIASGPADLPRLNEVRLDGRILAFTGLLTVVTTVLFGLIPAFQVSRSRFSGTLRENSRNQSQSRGQKRLRGALVVAEIALSLIVLIAAGLLLKTFRNLTSVDPGFRPKHLLTLLMVPNANYPKPGPRAAFLAEVQQRIRALPGVESVAETNFLPFTENDSEDGIQIEGRAAPAPGAKAPSLHFRATSPSYFHTMGIPLVRGAAYTDADLATPRTAVINETAARQLWPGGDAIGHRIKHRSTDSWLTIVGVAGDVRHHGAAADPLPELYVPYPIDPYNSKAIIVRTLGEPAAMASAARSAVWSVNRNQSIYDVRSMEEVMERSLAQSRFNATMISAFALSGLLLAAVGVYAVMAYSVSQRVQEIGIRIAMGATVRDVLRLILGETLGLALVGLAIGVVGALLATKLLSGLLFGVGARDPLTFVLVSLLMVCVSLVASLLPAVRATRFNPVNALY